MKKALSIINIVLPIILFILLYAFNPNFNFVYIIIMTLFVGWIIPYLNLIITGLAILNDQRHKLIMVFNFFNVFLNVLLIFLIMLIIEKSFIIFVVEYSIMLVLSIFNIIYLKKIVAISSVEEKKESQRIKQIKKETDGIIK